MTAPGWMNAAIGEFGRAAGLSGLALSGQGTVALRFETGAALRFEYTGTELVMAVTFPAVSDLTGLLSAAHPEARLGARIRAGIMPKTADGLLAVRLAERDVTLPHLNTVFALLWRLASEIGGAK